MPRADEDANDEEDQDSQDFDPDKSLSLVETRRQRLRSTQRSNLQRQPELNLPIRQDARHAE